MSESRIEFVSYDGSYPNLCTGTLIITLDGKPMALEHILGSGGSVSFNSDWEESVSVGAWEIYTESLPPDFSPSLVYELTELVNDNIEQGCCGGCV